MEHPKPSSDCSAFGAVSGQEEIKTTKKTSKWRELKKVVALYRSFPRRNISWVQLAGHSDGFRQVSDPNWILKLASSNEKAALEQLQKDPLAEFAPGYAGIKTIDGLEFVQMQNLLFPYGSSPKVFDIKIGCRTFLEKDVSSSSPRMDLLEKLQQLDPDAPTEEEFMVGVTKLRYMQFREFQSSSASLCFRLEAMRIGNSQTKDFKFLKEEGEVMEQLKTFLQMRVSVQRALLERLRKLRQTLSSSPFFDRHELIGSSLLFIFDSTNRANVYMIDFGKTVPRDDFVPHDVMWDIVNLNHADGYLLGVDNLIRLLESIYIAPKARSASLSGE
jgi:1D-myo-inositol-triphosphate 3-kinase